MDLMKALREIKRGDVIYFKDQTGRVNTCLVYRVGVGDDALQNGVAEIAGPDVKKHWESLNPMSLSTCLQNGMPVFEREEPEIFNLPMPDWTDIWLPVEAERELHGFTFKGEGWYFVFGKPHQIDTLLVLAPGKTIPGGKVLPGAFRFHCWNNYNPIPEMTAILNLPVRRDERVSRFG